MEVHDTYLRHPLRVFPSANKLLGPISSQSRKNGYLNRLINQDDNMMLEVLSYLDAESLSNLKRCNRTLYVYGTSDSLWRDLVLIKSNGRGIQFFRTWQDTYVKMTNERAYSSQKALKFSQSCRSKDEITGNGRNQTVEEEFAVYSDALYKPWICARINYQTQCPGFYNHEDIDRVDSRTFSVKDFINQYETQHKPVLFTNALEDWAALTKWQDPNYLLKSCQDFKKRFRATSAAAAMPAYFTMAEYLQYSEECGKGHPLSMEEAPLYLFERNFCDIEAFRDDYQVPKYFSIEERAEMDLFRLLGERARPDHRWLVIGPKRSGSLFHIDPNATHAWNACIKGKKKWIFYPPGVHPPGVQSSADGAEVVVPISTAEWLLTFWNYHLQARNDSDPRRRPIECIQNAGELMFVPRGYWHMVVNLEDNIAITHNYLASTNLKACLKFLRHTPDQISGVRDRIDEDAIQPEEILPSIIKLIRENIKDENVQRSLDEDEREYEEYLSKQIERKRLCSALISNHKSKKTVRQKIEDDSETSLTSSETEVEQSEPVFSFSFEIN